MVDRKEIYQQYKAEQQEITAKRNKRIMDAQILHSREIDRLGAELGASIQDAHYAALQEFKSPMQKYHSLYPNLFDFVKMSPFYREPDESEPDND